MSPSHHCRICQHPLKHVFADLGDTPLANSLLKPEEKSQPEDRYPLCAYVCERCFLVQLPAFTTREKIFEEYCYFSSFSDTWMKAAEKYANETIERFDYDRNSLVIEIGSNDGYLLQYFQKAGVPVLGIEPARNVAREANAKGIPTRSIFFGVETAENLVRENLKADHVAIKNVMAHVPDLHDFVGGLGIILKPSGTLSVEFPHLLQLMRFRQFDTIYHEHFCYLSLMTVENIFAQHGLRVFDVEEVPTHGGSLRVWAELASGTRPASSRLSRLRHEEHREGLDKVDTYTDFQRQVEATKASLLKFLQSARASGKSVVAYGAPAKGNTLLNFCGVGASEIQYTVDKNPYKQGRLLPGTHIPVYGPEKIRETKPDYIVILPWNLKEEIVQQNAFAQEWGCRFVVPIPEVELI